MAQHDQSERQVTKDELAAHSSRKDSWLAIKGEVFDVTEFVDLHPGGVGQIMRGCGRDATELFMSIHPSVNYKKILKKHYIGSLCEEEKRTRFQSNDSTSSKSDSDSEPIPKVPSIVLTSQQSSSRRTTISKSISKSSTAFNEKKDTD